MNNRIQSGEMVNLVVLYSLKVEIVLYQPKKRAKNPFLTPCSFSRRSLSFLQSSFPLTSQARVQQLMADCMSPVFLWQSPSQLCERASLLFLLIDFWKYYFAYSYFSSLNRAAPTLWQLIELSGSKLMAFLWFQMAESNYLSLYRAAPRFLQQAGTVESSSMALLVSSAFYCMLPSFPWALPFMLQNSLSSSDSNPRSQHSISSFHFFRCIRALALSRYLSRLGGRLLAYSSNSAYCFFAFICFILACFYCAMLLKLIGFPCSMSSSSISIPRFIYDIIKISQIAKTTNFTCLSHLQFLWPALVRKQVGQ